MLSAFPAGENHWRYAASRLKRIPPLSELESEKKTNEVTA